MAMKCKPINLIALVCLSILSSTTQVRAEPLVYYADTDVKAIRAIGFDGEGDMEVFKTSTAPRSISVGGGQICWTDIVASPFATGRVYCSSLDGSDLTVIDSGTFSVFPVKVHIDSTNSKVYWSLTDGTSEYIKRANLDGTNVENVVVVSGFHILTTFVVEPLGEKIYYLKSVSGSGTFTSEIYRANLDGSSEELLVSSFDDLGGQADIELDTVNSKFYWTSKKNSSSRQFHRANFDGTTQETLSISPLAQVSGEIAIDPFSSYVYWTDRDSSSPAVMRASFDGLDVIELIASPSTSNPTLGIAIEFSGVDIKVKGNSLDILSGDNTPNSLDNTDFGSADISSGLLSKTFDIYNLGEDTLSLPANPTIEIIGANARDFSVLSFPSTEIDGFSSSSFSINFDPSIVGLREAVVSIKSNDPNEAIYTFLIQGTGTSSGAGVEPEIAISGNNVDIVNGDSSPNSLDNTHFGEATVSGALVQKTFAIDNLGEADLHLTGEPLIQIVGSNASDFSVTSFPPATISASGSLLVPETQYFSIAFEPLDEGLRTALVRIFSDDANETIFQFTIQGFAKPSDFDGDGDPDITDPDDDNDFLSDVDEVLYGTDPFDVDTDDDGVWDGQEVTDGSNPTDNSSFAFKLKKTFCADWNGFIGMIYNIAEFTNFTSNLRNVKSTLFSLSGENKGFVNFGILSGAQNDLLVHDMNGWQKDSIGTVCSTLTDSLAQDGDIDGRMLQYKPDGQGSFDYVLSMPFINPLSGPLFVQFNTYHPSLDPAEFGFFTANWFTIANSETFTQSGRVIMYDTDGVVLSNQLIAIEGLGRRDFSVHDFGANKVGLVEWRPNSTTAKSRATLNRYVYNATTPLGDVKEAVSLPAVRGSKQARIAAVDTRGLTSVLEISNTSSSSANVSIKVNSKNGTPVINSNIVLWPHATQHFVLDGNLVSDIGIARVQTSNNEPIVVNVLQYGRNAKAGITNMYALDAREAIGSVLQGTYNTFLQQGCFLYVGNLKNSPESINITATRYDGSLVVSGLSKTIPANGLIEYDLCSVDIDNAYGVVRVQSTNQNSIAGSVVRFGYNDNYRIATPIR